jgi:hypothetical protein
VTDPIVDIIGDYRAFVAQQRSTRTTRMTAKTGGTGRANPYPNTASIDGDRPQAAQVAPAWFDVPM